jgi:serine/threonine protein kinase
MCKTTPKDENDLLPRRIESVNCVLGDFSSAFDEYSKRNLYAQGASMAELTEEYAPPEVILQNRELPWSPFSIENPYSYDSWSIGVVVSLIKS